MRLLDILMYFMLTVSATACGVCYAMAIDTIRRKGFAWFWAIVLSVLITPFGAWIVALILREGPPPAAPVTQPTTQQEQQKA